MANDLQNDQEMSRRKIDAWVRRLNALGCAMDEKARTQAVTDATREAITRTDRAIWKKIAADHDGGC